MTDTFDVIIAGAGLTGCLLASKLTHAQSKLKVAVLERESLAGGRLRSSQPGKGVWSYGLNFLTPELYQLWDQELKVDPDGRDLGSYSATVLDRVGLLSGSKLSDIQIKDFFAAKGARSLGGLAAARDWKHVDEVREMLSHRKDQAFHSLWPGNKKSPAVVILEQIVSTFGIADLWSTAASTLFSKAEEFCSRRIVGQWEDPLQDMVSSLAESVEFRFDANCVGATFDEEAKEWIVTTRSGGVRAKALVIAQSPWQALNWLPKKFWPAPLLQLAVKAKPVSVVVLSELIADANHVDVTTAPAMILVPAEGVQVVVSPGGNICYQATIDYEISLQAPDVVKAVRQLKRARKKLQTVLPGLAGTGDHLALLPVAWAQPPSFHDRRMCDKLKDRHINSNNLMFCGDSYGSNAKGDLNIVQSLGAVYARLTGTPVPDDLAESETSTLQDSDEVEQEAHDS